MSQQPPAPQPNHNNNYYGTAAYDPNAAYSPFAGPGGLGPEEGERKVGQLKTWLLISLAIYVISVIPGLIMAFDDDAIRASLETGYPLPAGTDLDMLITVTKITAVITVIVVTLIAVALYLIVYFGLKKTKNWARILGIVCAIASIVVTFSGAISFFITPDVYTPTSIIVPVIISVASIAVNIVWLVLAFNKSVAQYFQAAATGYLPR